MQLANAILRAVIEPGAAKVSERSYPIIFLNMPP